MSNFIGVTLTGIDQSTDLDRAIELSRQHELLEWGILLGGTPSPRYPSIPFIQEWADRADRAGIPIALHLCGRFARAWIDNDPEVVSLANQFGRVQVNVVAARTNVDALVEADEWQRRRDAWQPPELVNQTPWQEIYRRHVGQLADGGCLELATAYQRVGRTLPRDNH